MQYWDSSRIIAPVVTLSVLFEVKHWEVQSKEYVPAAVSQLDASRTGWIIYFLTNSEGLSAWVGGLQHRGNS